MQFTEVAKIKTYIKQLPKLGKKIVSYLLKMQKLWRKKVKDGLSRGGERKRKTVFQERVQFGQRSISNESLQQLQQQQQQLASNKDQPESCRKDKKRLGVASANETEMRTWASIRFVWEREATTVWPDGWMLFMLWPFTTMIICPIANIF